MNITAEYLQEKYAEFNELCFGGTLPTIPIRITSAKTFLGKLTFKRKRNWRGKYEYFDYAIRINTRIEQTEAELEDTLIHEMIHFYIMSNGIKDSSSHGPVFRQIMSSINEKHGRHITISHKLTSDQQSQANGTKPKWRVIALVTFKDGRQGIKVLPKIADRLKYYRRNVLKSPEISSVEFYWSKDNFFAAYPKSTALKVYFIEKTALETHLKDAQRINI